MENLLINKGLSANLAKILLSSVLLISFFSGFAKEYSIDKASSTLEWEAKKVTGQHVGTLSFGEGIIQVEKKRSPEGKWLLNATGVVVVNRTKYDINYWSGSFFSDLGDKMIYDDFTLKFKLAAVKK